MNENLIAPAPAEDPRVTSSGDAGNDALALRPSANALADAEEQVVNRLERQPKEVGYLLLTAGAIGFVLPGPGTPALVAGGLILWPQGFRKVEGWFQRKFPLIHRTGMSQLGRYLDDLENRYPGSTAAEDNASAAPTAPTDQRTTS